MSLQPADPAVSAPALPRRTVLRGAVVAGAAGLAVPALAACGGGGDEAAAAAPGEVLTSTAAVPIGGGLIVKGVVVTQPTEGTFKAFNAACPHKGCPVSKVGEGVISCPCHGSTFSITDGSVKNPPAEKGLDVKNVTVTGGQITLA